MGEGISFQRVVTTRYGLVRFTLDFPRFSGRRLEQVSSSPRTQSVNASLTLNVYVADCRTLRSIRRRLVWRLLVLRSAGRG